MADTQRVEVESDGTTGGTTVSVDGKKIGFINSLKLTYHSGDPYGMLELVIANPKLKLKGPTELSTHEVPGPSPIKSIDDLFDPRERWNTS